MLDFVVILVMALGFYLGYSRGLIKTLFDTLSIIVAILAALKLSPTVIGIFQKIWSDSPKLSYIFGVVVTFIGVIFLIRFIGKKLESLLEAANVNFVNKMMGGGLQAFFFAYILSLGIWLISSINLIGSDTKSKSITYGFMEAMPEAGKAAYSSIKPLFKSFWDKTSEIMDGVKAKTDQKIKDNKSSK